MHRYDYECNFNQSAVCKNNNNNNMLQHYLPFKQVMLKHDDYGDVS